MQKMNYKMYCIRDMYRNADNNRKSQIIMLVVCVVQRCLIFDIETVNEKQKQDAREAAVIYLHLHV